MKGVEGAVNSIMREKGIKGTANNILRGRSKLRYDGDFSSVTFSFYLIFLLTKERNTQYSMNRQT